MGGSDERGLDIICRGDDVIVELNNVFGDPRSDSYKKAQANNTFWKVKNTPGNYTDLIEAYKQAGLVVTPGWRRYLGLLGTLVTPSLEQGPQNIYDIAQFRYNGLLKAQAMSTDVHVPENGGHVHTQPGHMPGEPNAISSPCPLPPE
jgi:hypothetical protein